MYTGYIDGPINVLRLQNSNKIIYIFLYVNVTTKYQTKSSNPASPNIVQFLKTISKPCNLFLCVQSSTYNNFEQTYQHQMNHLAKTNTFKFITIEDINKNIFNMDEISNIIKIIRDNIKLKNEFVIRKQISILIRLINNYIEIIKNKSNPLLDINFSGVDELYDYVLSGLLSIKKLLPIFSDKITFSHKHMASVNEYKTIFDNLFSYYFYPNPSCNDLDNYINEIELIFDAITGIFPVIVFIDKYLQSNIVGLLWIEATEIATVIYPLIKYHNFKITHCSYLNDFILPNKFTKKINNIFMPKILKQFSDISHFPKYFE